MDTDDEVTTTFEQIKTLESQHVLQTYKRAPVAFVRGEGTRLFDSGGRSYLDFISGIGVVVLGHAHPGLAAAIGDQARTLIQTSNLYYHPLQGQLAARLADLSGLQRAFFCNSGTEAVEACLKFARRYWYSRGQKQRTRFVALEHGFSGRTLGALSVTANVNYRQPFEPLVPGVTFVSPDDAAGLEAAVTDETAAIIAEPIQGEGGVRPLPTAFAAAIERVCERTGALLIADEVQCGLGRTGEPFYFPVLGLTPDLVSVGKALGSGVPIGAALVAEPVAAQIFAGDHGSTYGGNLLSTRAALYVLEQLTGTADAGPYQRPNGLIGHVREMAPVFDRAVERLASRHAVVAAARGMGVMRALELRVDAAPVVEGALKAGLLVNRTAERVVRMLPPLTVTGREIEEAVEILGCACDSRTDGGEDMNSAVELGRAGQAARAAVPRARRPHLHPRRRQAAVFLRAGTADDAAALHALIAAHLEEGHLLPREAGELAVHASRFVVAVRRGRVVACAELAPLSGEVAEVRSLVVAPGVRGLGIGGQLLSELQRRARRDGFQRLCAFTHDAGYFVRLGFTLVPHVWVPEKIARDCHACSLFRRCGQQAVILPLASRRV
jgi:predicted acetylornithine/succinylornithine family transaminase